MPRMEPANFAHAGDGQERRPDLIDVLDRVLDKGIVIIYDINISVVGLHVVSITGNTIVASIETYERMTDDAVVEAQHSLALSHATDEFLRRIDHNQFPNT